MLKFPDAAKTELSAPKRRTRAEVQQLAWEFMSSGMRRSEFCRSRDLSFSVPHLRAGNALLPVLKGRALARADQSGIEAAKRRSADHQYARITKSSAVCRKGEGRDLLRESLKPVEENFWQRRQMDIFESLPRGIILACLHSGVD